MRRILAACAAALLLAGAAGCSKSQDEIAEGCKAALDSTSTKTNRPDECDGLSDEDYKLLLMNKILTDQGLFKDGENSEAEITERLRELGKQ